MREVTLLRYPGGKAKIYPIVSKIIKQKSLENKIYVEPFAGGFGLGIKLLINSELSSFIINDLDKHIYSFWYSVFNYPNEMIELIENIEITIDEWYKQKEIYENYEKYTLLEVGFSTLFLNRTNFSGILKANPIGGIKQNGKYKLDCRFNKEKIINSIEFISCYKDRVEIYNFDVKDLINFLKPREKNLFYNFDPPYVDKGKQLYLNSFEINDHNNLKEEIGNIKTEWILTYDNHSLIKTLYKDYNQVELKILYSVYNKRVEKEILISEMDLNEILFA